MEITTLKRLIADMCNADKRNTDPKLQKAAELIMVDNVAEWYATITQWLEPFLQEHFRAEQKLKDMGIEL